MSMRFIKVNFMDQAEAYVLFIVATVYPVKRGSLVPHCIIAPATRFHTTLVVFVAFKHFDFLAEILFPNTTLRSSYCLFSHLHAYIAFNCN